MKQQTVDQIDAKGMLHVLGGDRVAYAEIVGLFLTDMPGQVRRLESRWALGGQPLCDVLHELAGACGAVGARRAEVVLRTIERRVKDRILLSPESLEDVRSLLRRIAERLTGLRAGFGDCREG